MLIVALTGNAGSGKSTLATMLQHYGADRLDTDSINRNLIRGCPFLAKWINEALDRDILDSASKISTIKLRSKVFESAALKTTLETILHPIILQNIGLQSTLINTQHYLLLEIPLLYETRIPYRHIDQTLLITTKKSDLIHRISNRSRLSTIEAENILNTQLTDGDKFSTSNAIVINNHDLNTLKQIAFNLHHNFLTLSKEYI